MTKKDAYIWYSGATDVTGKKLAKELKIDGGRNKPSGKSVVICWGAKTKESTAFPGGTVVLNHPDKIRANRNKYTTLLTLAKKKDMVAPAVTANEVGAELDKKKSSIALPLVGRTNYHQGGKGFWLCLTKSQVANAISEGAQYFQNYIDIQDEYRIHVANGKVIYAQKKVKRSNVEEAYREQHAEKIANIAVKNDRKLDKDTLDYVLGRLAKENSDVDMIVRSNRRGWKFSHVKSPGSALEKLAIDALEAVGLDFGAVDCCTTEDGKLMIIEINSGPGLDGTTFKTYAEMFEKRLDAILNPPKPVQKVVKAEPAFKPVENTEKPKSKLQSKSAKERLSGVRELLDLISEADEGEAQAVENLLKKRLGA